MTFLVDLGRSHHPQGNFDSIFQSIMSIFRLLTLDNWVTLCWDCMRSTDIWFSLYFVLTIMISNYLVLNLFLAILLDKFSTEAAATEVMKKLEKEKVAAAKAKAEADRAAGIEPEPLTPQRIGLFSHALALVLAAVTAVRRAASTAMNRAAACFDHTVHPEETAAAEKAPSASRMHLAASARSASMPILAKLPPSPLGSLEARVNTQPEMAEMVVMLEPTAGPMAASPISQPVQLTAVQAVTEGLEAAAALQDAKATSELAAQQEARSASGSAGSGKQRTDEGGILAAPNLGWPETQQHPVLQRADSQGSLLQRALLHTDSQGSRGSRSAPTGPRHMASADMRLDYQEESTKSGERPAPSRAVSFPNTLLSIFAPRSKGMAPPAPLPPFASLATPVKH